MFLNPVNQFEIRFTPILGFPQNIYSQISPFLKIASGVKIDNELSSRNAKVFLFFDDDHTEIQIQWDRILFRCTNNRNDWLQSNNSIVSTLFDMFSKIEESSYFNQVNNILFFGIFVNNQFDKQLENSPETSFKKIKDQFSDRYLTREGKSIFEYTDIGISFDNKKPDEEEEVKIGPYIGIDDINKHGVVIKDTDLMLKLANPGSILTYKRLVKVRQVGSSIFKETYSKGIQVCKVQWEK